MQETELAPAPTVERQPAAWMRKYDRPKSEKPSGAQRKQALRAGRPATPPKPRERAERPASKRQELTVVYGSPEYIALRQAYRSGKRIVEGGRACKVLQLQAMGKSEDGRERYRAVVRISEVRQWG
jgi:hypothetical protein